MYNKYLQLSFNDFLLFHLMFDGQFPMKERICDKDNSSGFRSSIHLCADTNGYFLKDDYRGETTWEKGIASLLSHFEMENGLLEENPELKEWWDNSVFGTLDTEKTQEEIAKRIMMALKG